MTKVGNDSKLKFLNDILEEIKPVIGLISQNIKIGEYSGGDLGFRQTESLSERGIILIDNFGIEHCERDVYGKFIGDRLILTENSAFIHQIRAGLWNCSVGSEWTSTTKTISGKEVLEQFELLPILSGIIKALSVYAKKPPVSDTS